MRYIRMSDVFGAAREANSGYFPGPENWDRQDYSMDEHLADGVVLDADGEPIIELACVPLAPVRKFSAGVGQRY